MRRFLSYCVEAGLSGESPKEYVVGTTVFDRKADYDPRVDPIVRVEARRLRAKLEEYYSGPGASDEIIIELPKGGYVPLFRRRTGHVWAGAPVTSVAVLPFTDLSRSSEDDYFSDGLTEELIHRLTRVRGLRVLAWPSASRLRGREEDPGGIREQLKVDTIVRGSVRRAGDQLKITAQLVDAASGEFRWSESYSRTMRDLLTVQEEIANSIASALQLALNRSWRGGATNLESHQLCLRGRYFAGRRTIESLRKSVACFERAAELDPRNVDAFAGLADGHILLSEYGDTAPGPSIERARAAVMKVLELDPFSAEAHTTLAMIRSHAEWRWRESEDLYRKAIDLNPGYARARHWYGCDHLALLARFDEALIQFEEARRLDPLSPIIMEGHASVPLFRREYEQALRELRAVAELEPSFHKAYTGMGRVFSLMGDYRSALEMFDLGRTYGGDSPSLLAATGQVHGLLGERAEALRCLERLHAWAAERHIQRTPFAILHLGLGEPEKALEYLEQAVELKEPNVVLYGVHPLYEPLRDEPRFQLLLKHVGFLP